MWDMGFIAKLTLIAGKPAVVPMSLHLLQGMPLFGLVVNLVLCCKNACVLSCCLLSCYTWHVILIAKLAV